jgi:glutamate-1-semialdehyde 2,1-aminomutase
MTKKRKTEKSRKLFEQAKKIFVGGVASALHKSKYEEYPIYIEYGKGSKVYDVDGNEYIDYLGGYGPLILGYDIPAVNEAAMEQLKKGTLFSAPTESLIRVSEKLVEIIPCADLVTYQTTGTEANMVAFRVARAYTGKDKIIKFEGHYHGWSDEEMISTAPDSLKLMGPRNRPWKTLGSKGQSEKAKENIIILPWNDIDIIAKSIKREKHNIAAIITEPVMCNCFGVIFPEANFLSALREITAQNDILLIFDEVITGFRLALGGAQEYYKVTPDLCTFGKAFAGGFPLSSIAGRKEVMESGVHIRGTFNANPLSIAACQATIKELEKPGFYNHLKQLTERLTKGINEIADKRNITLYCDNIESIWQISFGTKERMKDFRDNFKVDIMAYQKFRKSCLERGIRLHPLRARQYISAAHTASDIDTTLLVIEEVLSEMF